MRTSTIIACGVLLGLVLFTPGQAPAQGRFGFGVVFGEPTGVAWKYKMANSNAIAGAIGVSPSSRFRIHADYLWHASPFSVSALEIHYGLGAAFGFGRTDFVYSYADGGYILRRSDLGFGIRTVGGLTYSIPRSPVDLYFELAPLFIFAPGTDVGIDIGLGARFYPNG